MATGERWIAGGRLAGGDEVAMRVRDGRVVEVARHAPAGSHDRLDLRGHWLAPFALDAHVHLAFAAQVGASDAADESKVRSALEKIARQMIDGGVASALDLGAPQELLPALAALGSDRFALELKSSGPLLCAPRGYPTQSWGQDGYGLAISSADEARAAVLSLHAAGARFAKLALDGRYPVLAPEVARAVVAEAKKLGMPSAAHALDVAAVRAALDAQVDILAHTPVEPLPEPLIRDAGARKLAVLSTLHAFGDTPAARENLARLAAAGCRPIYGTDLGNEGTHPGLSQPELRALIECGFSGGQILQMCTRGAAALLGEKALGHLEPGARAHILVLSEDPLRDPTALCRPAARLFFGVRVLFGAPLAASPLEHP